MLPLALILKSCGAKVFGSDRAHDKGESKEKFTVLSEFGVSLVPQDGKGVTEEIDSLVISSAVEKTVPDVQAALDKNIPILKRAELLAEIFHTAETGIGIAGTSGKSTVTGMIATIFDSQNLNPTVMNGGRVKNLEGDHKARSGSCLLGENKIFISEMDESDGSIDLFTPDIAVLNNIAVDHKTLDELKAHFTSFLKRSKRGCIINLEDLYSVELLPELTDKTILTYGIERSDADLSASNLQYFSDKTTFEINGHAVSLNVPGRHNVLNALAAIAASCLYGLTLENAVRGVELFSGIKRRLERLGEAGGVTYYDDFAHNPDKIAASLSSLRKFEGRLIVMFQAHGFAPLRMMGGEIIEAFKENFTSSDLLLMPEVYYAGGTVDRSVTARHIIDRAKQEGVNAHYFEDREKLASFLLETAVPGDRVVIMGARDDTLTDFCMKLMQNQSQAA